MTISLEDARRLNGAIRAIGNHHRTLGDAALRGARLRVGQEIVLEALEAVEPRSQADLAEYAGCEPPTMSNGVAKLESAGLVERRRSERDARIVEVVLTDEGRARLPLLDAAWLDLGADTIGDLEGDEAEELISTLERLAAHLAAVRRAHRDG